MSFGLGLWLALLLNKHLPFKAFLRAIVLLPFIVPTALSAIAFWWIYDAQFSILSWVLTRLGWIDRYIDFLGDPWNARFSTIAANIWRGVPFVAITLLAGLQTISPSYYEAASLDGATGWQQFRYVTMPLLTPIIAVVMTFSVLFTFTDFQLIYVLTRGGPLNATHLMATLAFQRAIPGGALGEGAALATLMVPPTIVLVPSSALETMQLGGLAGVPVAVGWLSYDLGRTLVGLPRHGGVKQAIRLPRKQPANKDVAARRPNPIECGTTRGAAWRRKPRVARRSRHTTLGDRCSS